jgi:hypothetical protein
MERQKQAMEIQLLKSSWVGSPTAKKLGICPFCEHFIGMDSLIPHLVANHSSDELRVGIAIGIQPDLSPVPPIRCVCGHEEKDSHSVWSSLYNLLEHARINPEDHQAACLLGALITIVKE